MDDETHKSFNCIIYNYTCGLKIQTVLNIHKKYQNWASDMHPRQTKIIPRLTLPGKYSIAGSAHVLLDVQIFFATYLDFGILARYGQMLSTGDGPDAY